MSWLVTVSKVCIKTSNKNSWNKIFMRVKIIESQVLAT